MKQSSKCVREQRDVDVCQSIKKTQHRESQRDVSKGDRSWRRSRKFFMD